MNCSYDIKFVLRHFEFDLRRLEIDLWQIQLQSWRIEFHMWQIEIENVYFYSYETIPVKNRVEIYV